LAVAISAACFFRHLVLLFWNHTCENNNNNDERGQKAYRFKGREHDDARPVHIVV
jgi:hypothetical protein